MEELQKFATELNSATRLWQERYRTDSDYQRNCLRFIAESNRLIKIAERIMPDINRTTSDVQSAIVHREYASGCKYLHRGYYCPSLIQDAVVGNVKRGRLLKRFTARTKNCWEYGFDAEGKLLCCESLVTKESADEELLVVATRELLLYEDDRRYGITLRSDGHLESVTEEIFKDKKCVSYTYASCSSYGGTVRCSSISSEHYAYEGKNMYAQWHQLTIPAEYTSQFLENIGVTPISVPIYRCNRYSFELCEDRFVLVENN